VVLSPEQDTQAFAQIFHGTGQPFQALNLPLPELKPGELLVKMSLATICGSDMHTIKGTRKEPTPLVLGHEGIGVITAMGPSVNPLDKSQRGAANVATYSGLKLGDRISWSIADACGACHVCTDYHMPQKCDTLFKYGHAATRDGSGLNGTYASHVIIRAGTHVVKLPSNVPDDWAAPANCALATVANVLEKAVMPAGPNDKAVVQGGGLLGLYSAIWLREELGFKDVYLFDPHESRLELARQFGAHPFKADYSPEGAQARVQFIKSVAPRGVDVVVEMAGSASAVPEGVQMLRFGGHYAIAGMVHPDSKLDQVTGEQLIRKCVTMRGSHNYAPIHLDQSIAFLSRMAANHAKTKYPFDKLVSPPYKLKELPTAVEAAESQRWPRVSVQP